CYHPLSSLLTSRSRSAIYPLSLHDALPIFRLTLDREVGGATRVVYPVQRELSRARSTDGDEGTADQQCPRRRRCCERGSTHAGRSEEHTSELQSRFDLVCRLLLEKKKKEKH